MTSPRFAVATATGRFYSVPGYEDVSHVSVTNIVGIMDKPALSPWAAKLAGERAVFQETEWHAIQQEKGDEAARKWISAAPREYGDYTCDLGSAVHFACEHFDKCEVTDDYNVVFDSWLLERLTPFAERMAKHRDTTDKNIEHIRKHVCQFARAIDEHGIDILVSELTVFDPEVGYAGTLDCIATIDGKTYVGDYKTGNLYPESYRLQLGALRHAPLKVVGNKTTTQDIPIDGGFVLQLKPASYNLVYAECGEATYNAFLAAKQVWYWKHEESKEGAG